MSQFKIVLIRGQNRGNPPKRGPTRDGPMPVGGRRLVPSRNDEGSGVRSSQFAVGSSQFAVRGLSRGAKQRGIGGLELFRTLDRRDALAVKRRWGETMPMRRSRKRRDTNGVLYPELTLYNYRVRTQEPGLSRPRDWPTITCSLESYITMNRDKDRWRTTFSPATNWQGGRNMSSIFLPIDADRNRIRQVKKGEDGDNYVNSPVNQLEMEGLTYVKT